MCIFFKLDCLLIICIGFVNGSRFTRNSGIALPPDMDESTLDRPISTLAVRSGSVPPRLPDTIIPKEYFIKIDATEDNATFMGFIAIEMLVLKPTQTIKLHMHRIKLLRKSQVVVYVNGAANEITIQKETYDPSSQMQTITLGEELAAGISCVFSTTYQAQFASNTIGLNKIYFEEDGQHKRILATYLQPIGARLVFPCFDEPHLKAHFTIHVARRSHETVISNMPLNATKAFKNDLRYVWDEFERSVLMSTYLVAFVIFDFKNVKISSSNGKSIKVWARKEALEDTMQAALLASKSLTAFENLLGVNYPLTKLDYVAVPTYPVPGMENFGLVVSREDAVLSNSLLYRKEWVSTVIAHETAHQWIGNLVTPSWWSQFWLSEGFATYLAAVALEKIDASLESMNHLLVREGAWVRRSDEGPKSTSLIISPFDPLKTRLKNIPIYYKGAMVIRMLRVIMGPNNFDTSLQKFFQRFQFASVDQNDLFNFLNLTSNTSQVVLPASLHTIMNTWTLQKGYPLLTVDKLANGTFTIQQVEFTNKNPTTSGQRNPNKNALWYIPLAFATDSRPTFNPEPTHWMRPTRTAMTLDSPSSNWVIVNSHQLAYARINYDDQTWTAITKQLLLNHTSIPVSNRAQLVDDALYLFCTGHTSVTSAMQILSYLHKETSIYPWMSAFSNLKKIELLLRNEKDYPIFQEYMLSQLVPVISQLGFRERTTDSHIAKKHRLLLLSWACKLEQQYCLSLAQESFGKWMKNPNNTRVFPEFATDDFLCAAIKAGGEREWKFAFKQFIYHRSHEISFESSTPWTKPDEFLPNALACTRDSTLVTRYLSSFLDPKHDFTFDDVSLAFNSLTRSQLWAKDTWDFLILNFQELAYKYGNLPIPFIINKLDLFQFHKFGELFKEDPEYFALVQENIQENRLYVAVNTRLVSHVTKWLRHFKDTANIIRFT